MLAAGPVSGQVGRRQVVGYQSWHCTAHMAAMGWEAAIICLLDWPKPTFLASSRAAILNGQIVTPIIEIPQRNMSSFMVVDLT